MREFRTFSEIESRPGSEAGQNLPGTIEIVGGEVRITNPKGLGKYPTITPSQNTVVMVNNEVIKGTIVVTEDDQVKIILPNKDPVFSYGIKVTPDKLAAKLVINRALGECYILNEQAAVNHCIISAVFDYYYHPEYPATGQVLAKLEETGIVYGVNYELIGQIIEQLPKITENMLAAEIAHGKTWVEGQAAEVVFIAPGLKTKQVSEKCQPVVNPFGMHKVDSVSPGDLIAVKRPPKPGINGTDVFGKIVEAPQPQDLIIQAGDGVKLIHDAVVATSHGRPQVTKIYNNTFEFWVVPTLVIEKDLDIGVGNIDYDGNVVIHGSVLEGFRVWATGEVQVGGNVTHGEIVAGSHVKIGCNVISSRIRAGQNSTYLQESINKLKEVVKVLRNLILACHQVKAAAAFKVSDLVEGEGKLIYLLVHGKYRVLEKLVRDIYQLNHSSAKAVNPEVGEFSRILMEHFSEKGPLKFKYTNEINQQRETTELLIKKLEDQRVEPSDVTMYYCQNSNVVCSGDIYITGFGALISELSAGQSILIDQGEGIVRGGQLIACNLIKVNSMEKNVKVRLYDCCHLESKYVSADVTVINSLERYSFPEPCRHVTVSTNENGLLNVIKIKIETVSK